MRTDELLFEYFKLVPDAVFELFKINPLCTYDFDATVLKKEIKKVEKRVDGLLTPSIPEHPHYFVELQGYRDVTIYWRVLHEIGLYHELEPERGKKKWRALVLFLDKAHDPGLESLGPMENGSPDWLDKGLLIDLLKNLQNPSPVLDVLRPIVAEADEVEEKAPIWAQNLSQLSPPFTGAQARLQQIFIQFIVQKLLHLSRKEIDRMLGLTPLEQTVAGQELIQLGQEQGTRKSTTQHIIHVLNMRFGPVSPSVQTQLSSIKDLAILDRLFSDALTFVGLSEFEAALAAVSSS